LQSQRQSEAACRALLVEVRSNVSATTEMTRRQPGTDWPAGQPNPSWLSRSVFDVQLPYIVQRLDQSVLEYVVQAYGTIDAVSDMLDKRSG
jgi:hypothetical protein